MATLESLQYTKSFFKMALSRRPWMAVLALSSVLLGILTYSLLGKLSYAQKGEGKLLTFLLILDLACLSALTITIIRRLVKVWISRRDGHVGSKIHSRMVMLFGIIAAAPTLILTLFSAFFFHFGIQEWFDKKFQEGLDNASIIATSYFSEQKDLMTSNMLSVEHDLTRSVDQWQDKPDSRQNILGVIARLHGLSALSMYDNKGDLLASASLLPEDEMKPVQAYLNGPYSKIPLWARDIVAEGNMAVLEKSAPGFLGGLYKIHTYNNTYFVLGWRPVDAKIIDYAEKTILAAQDYKILESKKFEIQIAFSLIFGFVSLLILLGAIAVGLLIANAFARPVSNLMRGAKAVAEGSLDVKVPLPTGAADLKLLVEAFNSMVENLKNQKVELLEAYEDLEERKIFIESVLDSVSSGVIELDANGSIRVINDRAIELLHLSGVHTNQKLASTFPQVDPFFQLSKGKEEPQHGQVVYMHDGHNFTFFVRLNQEKKGRHHLEGEEGYVLTFDDITQQLQDQRKAAWSDVARRIAHEIKNPLTPIQLATERLKRKCAPQLKGEDAEIFKRCIDTIYRQVETIGGMVKEFSNFARMPAPEFKEENVSQLLQDAVALQSEAFPDINFQVKVPKKKILLHLDPLQFSQVLTNLLKNALEAVIEKESGKKIVECSVKDLNETIEICIDDAGIGWPDKERERLSEPYFTTKMKGTGLGLSIVKRVLEDHGALMYFEKSPYDGARVRIVIPKEIRQNRKVKETE